MKRLHNLIWFFITVLILTSCNPKTGKQPPVETAPTATNQVTIEPTPSLTGLETGWWNDTVFYEIFVRSFKDSNGDGIGDFNGITEMLDYLNDGDPTTTSDLGITGIWLMPINESSSYHGYDVIDYYSLESEYGTKEDFLHLVEEAHKRGIRIIVDLVINHTGVAHPWFQASNAGDPEFRDWYIWSSANPGYTGPWGEQVWYPGKNGYYYAVFWSGMPDLNLQNPAVTDEIYKITRFWLTEMNVDGFRLDAIRHFVEEGNYQENTKETHTWLQNYYQFYKSIDPAVFTVGEAWTRTSQIVEYVGDQVDIAFEFNLAEGFVNAANGPLVSTATSRLTTALVSYPAGQYAVFLTNHDQDRIMSVLLNDVQKAKLAAVLLLTSPGVPFLYYGEEIGMTGTKPDEDIRRPMQWNGSDPSAGFTSGSPWREVASDFPDANVTTESVDPDSLFNHYRELILLRNNHSALRTGKTILLETGSKSLYAILRYDDLEAFLILINVSPKSLVVDQYSISAKLWPIPASYTISTVMGPGDPSPPQVNSSLGLDAYQPFVAIPARSFAILHFIP